MKETNTQYLIDFKNIEILRNKRSIFEKLNFKLKRGELLYISSISSKVSSTLISSFYAHSPVRGENARILDYNLIDISREEINALRQRIGLVLKDQFLYENLSLLDNLEKFQDILSAISNKESKENLADWLTQFGLDPTQEASKMDDGESVLYAVAKSMLNKPEILFIEDHFSLISFDHQMRIMDLIVDRIRRDGISVVMIQSNSDFIERYPGMICTIVESVVKV